MVTLRINGKPHRVDASPDMPLLWVLRDLLGITGTKFGCGVALCGACTVHLDGIPRRACVMPVGAAIGHAITTIEGIGATPTGKKHAHSGRRRGPCHPWCGFEGPTRQLQFGFAGEPGFVAAILGKTMGEVPSGWFCCTRNR